MSSVIKGCEEFSYVYLDDFLIYSKTLEKHFRHIEEIFRRLGANCLKLKLKKCELVKDKTNYLGHEISAEGIRPKADKN